MSEKSPFVGNKNITPRMFKTREARQPYVAPLPSKKEHNALRTPGLIVPPPDFTRKRWAIYYSGRRFDSRKRLLAEAIKEFAAKFPKAKIQMIRPWWTFKGDK